MGMRAVGDTARAPAARRPALAILLLCLSHACHAGAGEREAVVLDLDGALGPATASYLTRGIGLAADSGAAVVILRIDTPGGLDTSMREVVRAILASPIPVIGFVAPGGARAASAGTYILYACHIAAMSPATNLGAATPIELGGGLPGSGSDKDKDADEDKEDRDASAAASDQGKANAAPAPRTAAERKAINDAVAYLRSLAEMRGRNADWAEQAVREAASLSASAALAAHVVDLLADDVEDLLRELDGRKVRLGAGEVRLSTTGLAVRIVVPDWRTGFLAAITNPNVALVLMMIGIYGLFFEFMSPGAVLPGALGGICLIMGLYALNALPVNYAGLALILLGMGLIVAEHFTPSFGVLGISGVAAFVIGATVLIDTNATGFAIAWPVIAAIAVTSVLIMLLVAPIGIEAQRRPVVTGSAAMLGACGRVDLWNDGSGYVLVNGERWRATSAQALGVGREVRVRALDGLTVIVEPITETDSDERGSV